MRKFKFRLSRLLNLKYGQEFLIKQELCLKQNDFQLKKELLAVMFKKKKHNLEKLSELQTGVWEKQQLTFFWNFLAELDRQIIEQTELVEESARKLKEVRRRLIQMTRERKVLEKLKQRHINQYYKELNREEQKLTDEIGVTLARNIPQGGVNQ